MTASSHPRDPGMWLDTQQAAVYLGLRGRDLVQLMDAGTIRARWVGGAFRFWKPELDAQLTAPDPQTVLEQTDRLSLFAQAWTQGDQVLPCPVCASRYDRAAIAEHLLAHH